MAVQASPLHTTAATRLAADGQRFTSGRRSLVDILAEAGSPLTIPEILTKARDLAQSSAYRNLVVLEKARVVQRIVTTDEFSRYELAEDLMDHHHHLVCTTCGSVQDVQLSESAEHAMHHAIENSGSLGDFKVESHRLDLFGVCSSCN